MDLRIPEKYEPWLSIGTCSWKYDSWKGLVYDKDTRYRPDGYLPDYSRHFRTVEVDQWFWSLFPKSIKLPETKVVKTYAASVPDDFVFTVKAPNSITLTHFYAKQPKQWTTYANEPNKFFLSIDLLKRFLDRLSHLGSKLGPIMFQFEYLNRKKMPSKEAFIECLNDFFDRAPKGFRYAVESRNPNYLSKPFFDFLRSRSLGYVFIEGYYMPPVVDIFRAHDIVTTDFSIIRLHGEDRGKIEQQTGGNWNEVVAPNDPGLRSAAEIVREFSRQKVHTFLNVNNHYEGSAPLTAERFLKQLGD